MRNVSFFSLRIEILQGFAGVFLVFADIVICSVGDSLEFLNAKGEFVFDIVCLFGIVRTLTIRHVQNVELGTRNANFLVEFEASFKPLIGELHAVIWMAEIFNFHLFKFPRAEGEVTRVDLVAECLADLGDAERNFLTC